jgi:hypothetical protein
MHTIRLFICCLLGSLQGCLSAGNPRSDDNEIQRTTRPSTNSEIKKVSKTEIEEISCPAGTEPASFTYADSFVSPLPDGVEERDPKKILLQIDICLNSATGQGNDSDIKIMRAVLGNSLDDIVTIIPAAGIKSVKFSNIVFFTGAANEFQMEIAVSDIRVLKLLGKSLSDSARYDSATFFVRDSQGILKPETGTTWGGLISYGRAFDPCPDGPAVNTFVKVSAAKIGFKFCPQMGTSGGFAAQLIQVTVTDGHPAAGAGLGKEIVVGQDEFSNKVEQKINHHNICDSIRITLPDATYAIAAGIAGIGSEEEFGSTCSSSERTLLPNPKPTDGSDWNSVFKISYREGTIVEGRIPGVMHPLKENPDSDRPPGGGGVGI